MQGLYRLTRQSMKRKRRLCRADGGRRDHGEFPKVSALPTYRPKRFASCSTDPLKIKPPFHTASQL